MEAFSKYLGVIPQLTYILKKGETMYSRMEKNHGQKVQRFSIRKYSFGAASVLLGTALLLGANGCLLYTSDAADDLLTV